MSHILCIADPSTDTASLQETLSRLGHRTRFASSLDEGLSALGHAPVDLVISTVTLPDGSGQELAELLPQAGFDMPVILLAAGGETAMSRDGVDVLPGSASPRSLREAVDRALGACGLAHEPVEEDDGDELRAFLVGDSPALRKVISTVRTVASTRATVLIQGESGTGKELLVRALHELSERRSRPFVAVNCAALPEGLVESTLFGHERGAFTGANSRVLGAFERADGGTLLLDEISELRLDLQSKLLRAIQERQFERVGGSRPVRVDVRVVATSNRCLEDEVRAGRFRSDLYYRLRVVPVQVPPLRDRREDIPALVRHFTARAADELGIPSPRIGSDALRELERQPWPGNVRELEHAVERAVILNQTGPLTSADFFVDAAPMLPSSPPPLEVVSGTPYTVPERPAPAGFPAAVEPAPSGIEVFDLKTLEKQTIERALRATGGHRLRAAELLGISDRTLRNKLNVRRAA